MHLHALALNLWMSGQTGMCGLNYVTTDFE